MAWALPDEQSDYADRVLLRLADEAALVPLMWQFEVANTLLVNERRNRIQVAETSEFLLNLRQLAIVRDDAVPPTIESLTELGRRAQTSAYDALYLEVAVRRRLPLATMDKRLRAGAQQLGVTLFDPR